MNAVKYALAVAVMALSATVSAQVVFVPDFPVKNQQTLKRQRLMLLRLHHIKKRNLC